MDINELIQLAFKYRQQGNFLQAESTFKEILEIDPSNFHILNYLGNVLQDLKKYDEAIDCYQKAIQINPIFAASYYHLGSTFEEINQYEVAIFYYQEAIKYDPNFCGSYNNLGNIFKRLNQEDKSIQYFEKAIKINPKFWGSYYNLAELLQNKGHINEAIFLYKKALQINPTHIASLNNLGKCLKDKGRIDDAIDCYQKAIQIQPDHAMSFFNLGVCYEKKFEFDSALFNYKIAIQFQPDYVEAHFNLALLLLLLGNYGEGLKEYEWRLKLKDTIFFQRKFTHPRWQTSNIGRYTILVYAEQGLGDVIQFIRYIPYVAKAVSYVIIECPNSLKSLLKNIEGVNKVISHGEEIPNFDFQCPIASLPFLFNTTLNNIPAEIPYIYVNPKLIIEWRNKLQNNSLKFKIGLVWAGNPKHQNDKNRSIPLSLFSPLFELSNIDFYSLQKGKGSEQIKHLELGSNLIDLTDDINDFLDTAALIENLDLVITVDTAVAHLAGALGKPVWTLLPFLPDWRWMLNRDDSPWYPTMRLFRQPSYGDWKSVIEKVKKELEKLLQD